MDRCQGNARLMAVYSVQLGNIEPHKVCIVVYRLYRLLIPPDV